MDPITIALLGITAVTAIAVEGYRRVKQKNDELTDVIDTLIKANEPYIKLYSLDPCDELIIEKVKDYLSMRFGNNYEAVFNNYQTLEEKKCFFQKIANELAAEMQIELECLTITAMDSNTYGETSPDGKNVTINEVLLIENPKQALRTLCHEFRHCMQLQAIIDNKWGFPPSRIAAWMKGLEEYGNTMSYYETYRLNIVENDANMFAYEIIND